MMSEVGISLSPHRPLWSTGGGLRHRTVPVVTATTQQSQQQWSSTSILHSGDETASRLAATRQVLAQIDSPQTSGMLPALSAPSGAVVAHLTASRRRGQHLLEQLAQAYRTAQHGASTGLDAEAMAHTTKQLAMQLCEIHATIVEVDEDLMPSPLGADNPGAEDCRQWLKQLQALVIALQVGAESAARQSAAGGQHEPGSANCSGCAAGERHACDHDHSGGKERSAAEASERCSRQQSFARSAADALRVLADVACTVEDAQADFHSLGPHHASQLHDLPRRSDALQEPASASSSEGGAPGSSQQQLQQQHAPLWSRSGRKLVCMRSRLQYSVHWARKVAL